MPRRDEVERVAVVVFVFQQLSIFIDRRHSNDPGAAQAPSIDPFGRGHLLLREVRPHELKLRRGNRLFEFLRIVVERPAFHLHRMALRAGILRQQAAPLQFRFLLPLRIVDELLSRSVGGQAEHEDGNLLDLLVAQVEPPHLQVFRVFFAARHLVVETPRRVELLPQEAGSPFSADCLVEEFASGLRLGGLSGMILLLSRQVLVDLFERQERFLFSTPGGKGRADQRCRLETGNIVTPVTASSGNGPPPDIAKFLLDGRRADQFVQGVVRPLTLRDALLEIPSRVRFRDRRR